jgi:hypothetical protein
MPDDQANWSPSPVMVLSFALFWAVFLIGMSMTFGPG